VFRLRVIPVLLVCMGAARSYAQSGSSFVNTNIFEPVSTPAGDVHSLSLFVLLITAGIFLGMTSLLVYALVRYRSRPGETMEPPQVFGSTQVELAWTIIPVLLITVLFLGTARVIFAIQDAPKPANALDVIVVGHQFWWEFRYPKYGVVTANELHVPQSTTQQPQATFLKLTSADVMHSFWVPRLAGKTDLLPNRVNEMWFDPHVPGVYLGQCAQFCGPEHAKMLLRIYVDAPEKFAAWIRNQQQAQMELPESSAQGSPSKGQGAAMGGPSSHPNDTSVVRENAQMVNVAQSTGAVDAHTGQVVFERQACVNCHTIKGTIANGRFGPDLTHLMSRDTIGAGIMPITQQNLLGWINDPNDTKPGCLMPAMHLTDEQNAQITAYLLTLH
jgi:cytochrome c oxidase subunit 2